MADFPEYGQYDALGLAQLVKKGEVTPGQLCEEAIARIETINPKLNAVIYKLYDQGRNTAKNPLPNGPFTGVPFLIKDLLEAYAGAPLTAGCKGYKNRVPSYDSTLIKRYKATGVVILGKTNTPEFGLMGITEPELFGPTRNPWDLERSPGGSSGGSAAAVASGLVPMASGGDGGGSIRIPSAHCGLFGLKPTRHRTPSGPDYAQTWQGANVEYVITRSVRDSAAMLDATNGPDCGASYAIMAPERPYVEELEREPGSLRIAFTRQSPLETAMHPDCVRSVEDAAKLLESLGHQVEEAQPAIDGKALASSYFALYFGEVAAEIAELGTFLGRKPRPSDVEAATWSLHLLGRALNAGEFVRAIRQWNGFARQMGAFLTKYDLYLTPTTAFPPVKIGELKPGKSEHILMEVVNTLRLGHLMRLSGLADKIAIESLAKTPFTQLANLTGLPAMSVPLFWTTDGLPIGSQFIGRFGDEATLFRLAAQLEKTRPWFNKRPAGY
jgi:amidase